MGGKEAWGGEWRFIGETSNCSGEQQPTEHK